MVPYFLGHLMGEVVADVEHGEKNPFDLQSLNPRLEIEGILLTMFDIRNNLSHQVAEEVRNHFKEKVFQTVIPRNVRLSEAPSHGKPVLLYDIHSKGAESYLNLASEIMANGKIDGD